MHTDPSLPRLDPFPGGPGRFAAPVRAPAGIPVGGSRSTRGAAGTRSLVAALGVFVALGLGTGEAAAQSDPPFPAPAGWGAEEREVLAVVQRLFDGMQARDADMVRPLFHPDARLLTATTDSLGAPTVRIQPIGGFISAVGGEGEPWNERIVEAEVRVDGGLAHAWVFYTFHAGEQFSHCGVDSIQLGRTPQGWVMLSLVDTRQQEGCPSGN